MNHPQIEQILHAASRTKYIENYHHGMTTGVALMNRKDKEAVIQSYFDHGYRSFGITLHGGSIHHDEIVRRKGAFDTTVSAAKFLLQMGAQLNVSLMMNRYYAEDAEEISRIIDALGTETVRLVNPIFTPHANMMAFEPHRATLRTFDTIRDFLPHWHLNEQDVMQTAQRNTVEAATNWLQTTDLHQVWNAPQAELYLTLHPDCKLYVGNSGVETRCLGDLRTLEAKKTADIINALPGNREYGAFFEERNLPPAETVYKALKTMPQDLVFGDFESVLYRVFAETGVPTTLICS